MHEKFTSFIHKHFLVILLAAYALAALAPSFGLWLRQIEFAHIDLGAGNSLKISLSLVMLSFLLFNAGLGIKAQELLTIRKKPIILLAGFAANMAVPLIMVLSLRGLMQQWHNSDELQNLLVGLAMIISMPIAGSSTAWAQNANGNLSLSLGLVFLSTVLSPVTTPLVLHTFGDITIGDYSSDLHEIAAQGTNLFMMLTVVLPSLLGILAHFLLGEKRTSQIKPQMKLANYVVLLLLNYSNASTALPQAFASPDLDFLGFVYGSTLLLCITAFGAGWMVAHFLKASRSEKASLMFGLGMNNNGTGLVLASATLADHPAVMLPMIFYTLAQQVVAALVDWKLFKPDNDSEKRGHDDAETDQTCAPDGLARHR